MKLNDINVESKGKNFNARNSANVTVNGKEYKKIDNEGISLDL